MVFRCPFLATEMHTVCRIITAWISRTPYAVAQIQKDAGVTIGISAYSMCIADETRGSSISERKDKAATAFADSLK